MSTKRLYREDRYLASCDAVITDIRERDGLDVIACSESVFYPEGGGQPSDIGIVSKDDSIYEVTHVYDESIESDVWHITDAPSGTFNVGDEVVFSIDFDHRFMNMQRHLGEHMLSGTIDTLFGGVNKGFHIGEDYVTIDIDLDGHMFTEDELDLIERTVNAAIWASLPVRTDWFDDYESSLALPVRKKVPHEGRVSVVTVGDPDDPYDCIACCGVHPASSAEVGLLAMYKCEPNKGMNRIYFDCGAAAKEKLSADSKMLRSIAESRSCSPSDLQSRLGAEDEKTAALKASLAAMCSYIKNAEREHIIGDIKESGASTYAYSSDILGTDDLLKLGFSVINEVDGLLLAMQSPGDLTCLLFSSGNAKCGELVKELAPKFGGKGGGRDDNARAIFANTGDMKEFVNTLYNSKGN